ncbi:hypothetical protein JST56_04720 [Candidatus Dependentiae bacterium]|nr:hypothetical protein [Candidatus Dependentiae bacterium]
MSVFRTYFSSCLALAVFSCATVQAEKFEFTLHDFQIKKDCAAFGLNLDAEWQALFDESGTIQENNRSELLQKICNTFEKITVEPPSSVIPSTDHGFSSIFDSLNYAPISEQSADHTTNSQNFNALLEDKHQDRVINCADNQINYHALLVEIGASIWSYMTQEAITARLEADRNVTIGHLHIYIKLIFDTEERTITLQTAPHAAQDCFVITYSQEDLASWVREDDASEELDLKDDLLPAPKQFFLSSSAPRTSRMRSCCGRFTKLATLSVITIGLGVLANSYMNGTLPDMVDIEALGAYVEELGVTGYIEQLTEYFGNLTITQ